MENDITVTDEKLDRAEAEAKALQGIIRNLKRMPPEKRTNVLRAAAILCTGQDLHELPK